MRLRSLVVALLLTLFALPSFAFTRDTPRDMPPREPRPPILKIIKKIFKSLGDPVISPPRP